MSEETRRTILEHASDAQKQDDEHRRSELLQERIERCSRALSRGSRGDYARVARQLHEVILPTLDDHVRRRFAEYDARLSDRKNWDWPALRGFREHGPDVVRHLQQAAQPKTRSVTARSRGLTVADRRARELVDGALASASAIAEYEEILMADYAAKVDAMGLGIKIGEHLQQEKMDLGDPVHAMSFQKGSLKILHGGGTGDAKSSGSEREAECFFQYDPESPPKGLPDPPKTAFKLIHLVDLDKGEAWLYDIVQQSEFLRGLREEKGLAPDFAADPDLQNPQIEIFIPLSDKLDDFELPYDTDQEEFAVTPFVIPASHIPKSLLVAAIMARVSNEGERAIRRAYDDVARERDDWGLVDLATEIRRRKELSDKQKSNAIGVLRSIQDEGYIRTKNDDRTLDWRAIFEDTDTVTVFSQAQALCKSKLGQSLLVSILIDRIIRLRSADGLFGLPEAPLIMPELWRVVPHNQRDASDDRVAAVQAVTAERMAEAARLNRRLGIHLICDTQKPYDLKNSVRELFNRYVIYSGTEKLAKGAFDWTGNSKYGSFYGSLTSKRGQAGIVGEVQPAIDERGIEYLSPVEYAPPSHHHFDKDVDMSGWHARAKYLTPIEECPECGHDELERSDSGYEVTCLADDCGETSVDLSLGRNEELREHEWETAIPERLEIEAFSTGSEDADDEEDGVVQNAEPSDFHRNEARNRKRQGESIRQIRANIPNNPDTGNPYSTYTIHSWTEDIEKPTPGNEGAEAD